MTEGPDRLEPTVPERQRADPAVPRVGEAAPDRRLHDETGTEVWLHTLWARTPRGLALVFVRHFGCPFCRAHVAVLRDAAERFHEEGLRIAVVGMGTPEECARFRRRHGLPFPVLSDPERDVYRAYGLTEGGAGQIAGLREIRAGLLLALRGLLPGRPAGNPRQLAGDFLIDRDGILRYARPARRAVDVPSPDALLTAAHELL